MTGSAPNAKQTGFAGASRSAELAVILREEVLPITETRFPKGFIRMRDKQAFVYIMASASRTIYIGVTSNLHGRVWQHKYQDTPGSFTARYACNKLVYFEPAPRMDDAIAEEKRLKGKNRAYKIALVESRNPRWNDLAWNWYQDA